MHLFWQYMKSEVKWAPRREVPNEPCNQNNGIPTLALVRTLLNARRAENWKPPSTDTLNWSRTMKFTAEGILLEFLASRYTGIMPKSKIIYKTHGNLQYYLYWVGIILLHTIIVNRLLPLVWMFWIGNAIDVT